MRHTNFKPQSETFSVINDGGGSVALQAWTFTPINGLVPFTDFSTTPIGNYYVANINAPAEDTFIIIRWGDVQEIIRIGNPPICLIGIYAEDSAIIPYTQYGLGGTILDSGNLLYAGEWIYYHEPTELIDSFFELNNYSLITLSLPYNINGESGTTDSGALSPRVFIDTPFRYGTFAFTGDRYSYFDLTAGEWKPAVEPTDGSKRYTAKASDIAKAFCHFYGVSYDRTDPDNVTMYINAIRAFNENTGFYTIFNPGITPENNKNNFDLIYDDEEGNTVYVGIQTLFVGTGLTFIGESEGVIFPFTNDGFN